jgi:S-adenosylmethionine:tRNA ribosyltransferase-isomerase
MLPTSAFEYTLPPHLIASHPAERREGSRLLVIRRSTGDLEHRQFGELPELLTPGDVLVLNETRVFPARLVGRRAGGGRAEVLLLHPVGERGEAMAEAVGGETLWQALVRPGARLRPGRVVTVADDLEVEVVATLEGGSRVVRLRCGGDPLAAIERHGRVPLPPYIQRAVEPEDAERYQTVYARRSGSVAAPTAGLHFTPALLERITGRGVALARLVLHVGPGTFRPVEAEDPAQHRMHAEWYEVPAAAAAAIQGARAHGGALWAVGTTVVRTLESVADEAGEVRPGSGWTDIFIRPPHRFRAVDRLITNFHLPRSTLLMLVAAFGGHGTVMRAYREAVQREYRFYSYGDAMALV